MGVCEVRSEIEVDGRGLDLAGMTGSLWIVEGGKNDFALAVFA